MTQTLNTTRRGFLAASGAGAASLVIGVSLGAQAQGQTGDADAPFVPNAFLRVDPDNSVTVLIKHIEFGQGTMTGLTTLVADEMDARWDQMRAEAAPANPVLYANSLFGTQGTGGSTAMASSWAPMRKAGAQAKAVLIAAAAQEWGVPEGEITVSQGIIRHDRTGRADEFGAFTAFAAGIAVPEDPPLKTSAQRTLIGREGHRIDSRSKVDGSAEYTIDVYRENMLSVAVLHPPLFGGVLASFDASEALAITGVVDVKPISSGLAIYAEDTFAAMQGRAAVSAQWDLTNAETRSTAQITADYEAMTAQTGIMVEETGDAATGLAAASTVVERSYRLPYLAHTPMEPLDAVLEWTDGGVEAWMGSQSQTGDQAVISQVLGLDNLMQVKINTMMTGGSFGRRAQADGHFAVEAATVLAGSPDNRPVKILWTRENDVRGGYYRPLTVHKVRAALGDDGKIESWDQVAVSASLLAGTPLAAMMGPDGLDPSIIEGARDTAYAIPNFRLSVHQPASKVPVLWWRSVGHTHTAFVLETMVDELLAEGGLDAVDGRLLQMKGDRARDAAVLRRVAEMADWGARPPEGRARGVAVHKSFNSYVAQIAEVSMEGDTPRVHKVWCAVDCGVAVNPDVIRAQMEGSIGYGLCAALFNEITLDEGGAVRQANWDEYRMLRMAEMPEIEVAIVDSQEAPTGVGEPGTPPIAPAVANAIRRLTGTSPTYLPFVAAR